MTRQGSLEVKEDLTRLGFDVRIEEIDDTRNYIVHASTRFDSVMFLSKQDALSFVKGVRYAMQHIKLRLE